jgi:hypothetical protein
MHALDEGAQGAKSTCKAFNSYALALERFRANRINPFWDLSLTTLALIAEALGRTRVDDEDDEAIIDIDNDSELPDYE